MCEVSDSGPAPALPAALTPFPASGGGMTGHEDVGLTAGAKVTSSVRTQNTQRPKEDTRSRDYAISTQKSG